MSSLVLALHQGVYGWFNVVVALSLLFLLKVVAFHRLVIMHALDTYNIKGNVHNRFLSLLLGVWTLVIPYIEIERFNYFVKVTLWEVSLAVSRLL